MPCLNTTYRVSKGVPSLAQIILSYVAVLYINTPSPRVLAVAAWVRPTSVCRGVEGVLLLLSGGVGALAPLLLNTYGTDAADAILSRAGAWCHCLASGRLVPCACGALATMGMGLSATKVTRVQVCLSRLRLLRLRVCPYRKRLTLSPHYRPPPNPNPSIPDNTRNQVSRRQRPSPSQAAAEPTPPRRRAPEPVPAPAPSPPP